MSRQILTLLGLASLWSACVHAEPPATSYIFPAGGQRGTTVDVHVGGMYLHEKTPWEMLGPGVKIDPELTLLPKTTFFEGPVIPLPDSQRSEDYPRDHGAKVAIAGDAPLGPRYWRTWNSQGATAARKFIVGELPEVVEEEIDGEPIPVPVKWPVTINGRMFPREDVDVWEFTAQAGQKLRCTAVGAPLGSPLDPRIEVITPQGRSLGDAIATPEGNATLEFQTPVDGIYRVKIHDIAFGGLQNYVYRLTIEKQAGGGRPEAGGSENRANTPDFRLTVASDVVSVERGGQTKLKVTAERFGGFDGPIAVRAEGLPTGVTVKDAVIPAKKPQVDLSFTADAAAKIGPHRFTIQGSAELSAGPATRTAFTADAVGNPELSGMLLAVALPTPFKFNADFAQTVVLRGSTHSKRYRIERSGYAGPLEVRLADRQGRHLQGVQASKVVVLAGVDEFDFHVTYPPWMELGRTTRTQLMATGVVEDTDGVKHQVCFTSNAQEVQIIGRVSPGLLSIQSERPSMLASPRSTARVEVQVIRAPELVSPTTLELIVPEHMHGLRAEPIAIPADSKSGVLEIHFGDAPGPGNMPVVLRATARDATGAAHYAETKLDVVLGK